MSDHPTQNELSGFVLGTLPPESTDSVAEHIEQCPPCQETVCELDAHKDTLLDGLRDVVPPLDEACRKFVEKVKAIPANAAAKQPPEPTTESLASIPAIASPAAATGTSREQFLAALRSVRLLDEAEWNRLQKEIPEIAQAADGASLARTLVAHGALTKFQATALYQGKTKGLVFGEYLVLDLLGAGGMGQVFKARHRSMDRVVALKVLAKAAINSPDAMKRFQREVKAAAKLNHPNIVTAYDAGQQDGTHFLVMEFVDGSDLSALVKRDGPLAIDKAVNYITQAARGLAFAHAKGVIHRDIKPANLLVDGEGVVKILDMGLARLDNEAAARDAGEGLTQTGQVMGTVDYMAPEQAFDTSRAGGKADVYSLGCTLHRLIVGQNMFSGETIIQKLLAHREQPIPSLSAARAEVPAALDTLYQRMVAKRHDDRPTMVELIVELEKLAKGDSPPEQRDGKLTSFLTKQQMAVSPVKVSTPAVPQRAKPQANDAGCKPPRKWLTAAAAAGFVFIALGVVLLVRDKDNNVVAEIDATEGTTVKVPAGGAVEVVKQTQNGPVAVTSPSTLPATSLPTVVSNASKKLSAPKSIATAIPSDTKAPAVTAPSPPAVGIDDNWGKQVAALPPEDQMKAVVKRLQELNPDFDGKERHRIEFGRVQGLLLNTDNIRDISPVRALVGLQELKCDGSYDRKGGLQDLSPLAGLPITELSVSNNPIADLTPLGKMPLTKLSLGRTSVVDLAPLSKLPLTQLHLDVTQVTDLAPLRNMPLTDLRLYRCEQVVDLSPLFLLPLVHLELSGTKVAPETVSELRKQLPSCKIVSP